ncbi:MAG: hypothetical protein H0X50_10845, partial [Nitrosopumilus sp.]|nr:hypothetical protein [Nitrosopumilus sp.]
MNNKIYLMAAILAFASVGALLTQPTLASAQSSMIENILDSALPTNNNSSNNDNDNDNDNEGDPTTTTTPISGTADSASNTADAAEAAAPISTSLSCGQVISESVKLSANLECS